MTNRVKANCKTLLRAAGHYSRKLRETRFPGIPVLCYHGIHDDDALPPDSAPFADLQVHADDLEDHCRLLRDCCNPMDLTQMHAALRGDVPLPPRPVLLTFDDGYRNLLRLAVPILNRYEIPGVAFVCSGPIERQSLIWYDAIARRHGKREVDRVKSLPHDEWKARCVDTGETVDSSDPYACLSVSELRQLAAMPNWEIGGHTADHCILARASREQQWEQISSNLSKLREWTGRRVTTFAYPNGEPGRDFTDEAAELLQEAGVTTGFCTRYGFARRTDPLLMLPRLMMVDEVSSAELAHRLCYSWQRNLAPATSA